MKQFCPRGHDTYVVGRCSNGQCRSCHNAATMDWKRRNPHRVSAADRRTYLKYPERRQERVRRYYTQNKAARMAYILGWQRANRGVDWWAREAKEAV